MLIIRIIEVILLCYFSYFAIYTLSFAFAGLFYRRKSDKITSAANHNRFAVFIPAYKEDGVIVDVAKRALNQSYKEYDVVIIADSLQPATLEKLRALPIETLEVSFEKSTKVKALNKALAAYEGKYEYAAILDADNIMDEDFLFKMNNLHDAGYAAIQGRRAAKNENNTLSYLDGLSEEINNHVFGKGSTALGLSSSLKGSGMSFKYDTLKRLLGEMESIGGFDRELELRLVNEGVKVLYDHGAVVYDEKVEKKEVFENQRKRWISSQFFYLKKYFFKGLVNLLKGRITYFNSSILRNIQLPRLISLGLITVSSITAVGLTFLFDIPLNRYAWISLFVITVLGTLFAIPRSYYNARLIKSIFSLPLIFWKMFKLLFNLKGANKKFIHTPHGPSSDKS